MSRFSWFVGVVILAVGCSRPSTEPSGTISGSATPVSFNPAGAPTVEFTVPDMMCPEGCGEKVKEILSKQPGVKEVRVEFETKTAIVAVDKDKFKSKDAIDALKDCQFKHSALKEGSGAEALTATATRTEK